MINPFYSALLLSAVMLSNSGCSWLFGEDGTFRDRSNDYRQAKVEPIYEVMEGWSESTRGARSWAELPATTIKYIRRIEEIIDAPVALLSTSPNREDVVLVQDPFAD